MRDFPVFSTENGVGSLVLKEIPYSGIAYIKLLDASAPFEFLNECVEFCSMAGAQRIYASGHEILNSYPFYTAIWKMAACRDCIPQLKASLFPVTEKTAQQWLQIYNQKMKGIPNSSYMSLRDMDQMVKMGGGYFVHENGTLLGIGRVSADRIEVVVSISQGAGERIVSTLVDALNAEQVQLEVASVNEKAVALYERLGFVKTCEISSWYQVK